MLMSPETENRTAMRHTTLKGGRIVFNASRSTFDCTVRNLSSKGAKLTVASVVGIPDTFDLILDAGARQSCRVVWRTLKEIGVEFQTAH
jgi:hypothetical protein